ncbi:MAG: hypothetical protein JO002_14530, partial [Burkholderiaceae bacterium]|nr:hypothetical protein [Burkholderiaceae bacterium]
MKRLVALCLACLALTANAQPAPSVWLSPNDPTHGGAEDFWDMLKPDAPWQNAKRHVNVFEISQNLVTNGPPDKLRQLYAYLKENHIALAIGIGMLTWSEQCGKHVEGYVPPGGSAYVAKRIRDQGGELAYIDTDEAVQFGRYYSGPNACHASLDAIAADLAGNLAAYKEVFPQVQLGETEIFSPHSDAPHDDGFLRFTQTWLDTLRAKTGAQLAFYHQDVVWSFAPALKVEDYVPKLSALMGKNHIPFGVILIAPNGDGPDAKWIAGAEKNIDTIK